MSTAQTQSEVLNTQKEGAMNPLNVRVNWTSLLLILGVMALTLPFALSMLLRAVMIR